MAGWWLVPGLAIGFLAALGVRGLILLLRWRTLPDYIGDLDWVACSTIEDATQVADLLLSDVSASGHVEDHELGIEIRTFAKREGHASWMLIAKVDRASNPTRRMWILSPFDRLRKVLIQVLLDDPKLRQIEAAVAAE